MEMTTLSVLTIALLVGFPLGVACFVAWRIVRLRRGVPLRPSLLVLLSLGYIALFVVAERAEWNRFPVVSEALDFLLLSVGVVFAVRYSLRHTVFKRISERRWVFHASILILLVWFFLFVSRLVLEVALTGHSYILGIPSRPSLSNGYVALLLSVDSLFAFSTGLLLGGNLGIFLRYREARREFEDSNAHESVDEVLPARRAGD
jgi:hypothetical protein